jgi:hypothetical protein|tara:strand:- start:309 stop:521 length:213 start_codon:yes stop_codon:yes gene_type:complete
MKDFKKLREQAVRQEFRQTPMLCEGDYVMSARTGEKGKIHRTGVNYCIIVTEGGNMFREWVKDVRPINKP